MDRIQWHIEPTSKCILECPLCDRTWFYEKFKRRLNNEINVDHLINFLKGTSPNILLCGNNGDPIYHSQFHELCRGLKGIGSKIEINTNGSGKKKEWWTDLCSVLSPEDDLITFSIDGLEDTNHIYRINAKWESIMEAIETVHENKINTTWKFIVFKHNQHQIKDAEQFSRKLGFKNFKLIKSDRWWHRQDLMPTEEFVDSSYKHQAQVTKGTDDKSSTMRQRCMSVLNGEPDTELYIDSDGDFYPCCKTGLYAFRYKNIFSPKDRKFNIRDNTVEQILNHPDVKGFFDSTKSYDTAFSCCKIYCRKKEENLV